MNHNQLNLKDIFLSTERDFSADAVAVKRKNFKMQRLDIALPSLFGLVAFVAVYKFNKSAFSEVTFNSLNEFYTIYANEITSLIQQVSF